MDIIVSDAIKIYAEQGNTAYLKYTKQVLHLFKTYYPITNMMDFYSFDEHMRTARAVLSQNIGAASKRGKWYIIVMAADDLSRDPYLSLSCREAHEMLKHGAGRVVNKNDLKGVFKYDKLHGRTSPFFKNRAYREKMLNHPVIERLKIQCDLYDKNKPKLNNPFKYMIDDVRNWHKDHKKDKYDYEAYSAMINQQP